MSSNGIISCNANIRMNSQSGNYKTLFNIQPLTANHVQQITIFQLTYKLYNFKLAYTVEIAILFTQHVCSICSITQTGKLCIEFRAPKCQKCIKRFMTSCYE